MEVLEAIRTRRSVRRHDGTPVDEETLARLLEAVRAAPSWANRQCWRMIVVRDPETKAHISRLSFVESYFMPKRRENPAQAALAAAPVVIVLCADPTQSGELNGQSYYLTDAGIAAENLMLAAHAAGLGTVFVGVFHEEGLRGLLGIPPQIRVVGLFPVGRPAGEPREGPKRKPLEEICFRERWNGL